MCLVGLRSGADLRDCQLGGLPYPTIIVSLECPEGLQLRWTSDLGKRLRRRGTDVGAVMIEVPRHHIRRLLVSHVRQGQKRLLAAVIPSRFEPGDQHLRSEEHTSELQSRQYLVCRLLLEKKNNTYTSS